MISPSTLEQIRAANDIVDVIGSYFPLKRAGANFVALCPFHKEKTPSFHVNPSRQIFHCFGCQKGGDVFSFVQEYEHLPFVDAVRRLAERARIPLEFDNQPGQAQTRHLKERLLEVHEQITRRWHACLLNEAAGQPARDYLQQRQVAPQAIQRFRLGYAPENWDDTVNWAKSKNYDLDLMEKAGLILRKESSGHPYDRFRGRLIFPIQDEQGRVIGFSGRLLSADAKAAKYVNSPETPIFHKSRVFFGLDKSRRALLDAGLAIICEGQLDLIACHMVGIENVVAPQGTAFTSEHARILKRYVDRVVLCFDADDAGQAAAVRAWESLLASELTVSVALIPPPHDPDSFLREHGPEPFRQIIQTAPEFFEFYLSRLCQEHDPATDHGRRAITRAMAEALFKTNDHVLIDTYGQKTAHRLGVAADAVRAEFRRWSGRHPRPDSPAFPERPPAAALPKPSPSEAWLVRILFLHDDLVDWVAQHLDLSWLRHPQVQQAVRQRLQTHASRSWHGLASFLQQLDDPTTRQLITEAASASRAIPDPERTLKGDAARKGIVEMLRNEFIDRQLADLQRETGQPNLQPEDVQRIEKAKSDWRHLKSQPLSPLPPPDPSASP